MRLKALSGHLTRLWNHIGEGWRFAITAFFFARLLYAVWAWLVFSAQPMAVQNLELSGEPIVTIFDLRNSRAHIYRREMDGQTLTFRAAGANTITDVQTGSLWDISTGSAIRGPSEGSILLASHAASSEVFPYHNARPYPIWWLAIWQRFDANWYVSVAETGYGSVPGDDHFPPLFPVLIRLLKPVFGSAFLAGLLLSHMTTLYALKLLYETFQEWGEDLLAKKATLLFLIYPASFFLFSVYSESLFLVAALLALRRMRSRSWAWAGFWAFCAILTRLQGAALLIPMVFLMRRDPPWLRKPAHWIGLALPGLAGLFYLFLRSTQVGAGAVPLVESAWHARLVAPWETYGYALQTLFSGNATFIDVLNWAVVTLFLGLLVIGWRRIPLEYNLYSAFSLLIILIRIVDTQPLISMSRYALTLFPGFFVLSLAADNPWMRRLIVYVFIPLNLYLSAQFFSWGWVA
jgi:hypothetical protein